MNDLLRQYAEHECGPDGYPFAWHYPSGEIVERGGTIVASAERPAIKDLIREQAGHRCRRCWHPYRKGEHGNGEWSPCDAKCRHGGPLRLAEIEVPRPDFVLREAQWRILTVHHLDEDKANCRWWNLAALCQRCHLRMQRAVVMDRPWHFEHSEWFKPYAAGFYAWKYLDEDLGREEVDARMDELLALEHRFTQEALNL